MDRKRMSIGAVIPPTVGSRSVATTEREASLESFGGDFGVNVSHAMPGWHC